MYVYIGSCVSDCSTGKEGGERKAGEAEMEGLIERRRERAKWTVICSVPFPPTYTVSPVDLI